MKSFILILIVLFSGCATQEIGPTRVTKSHYLGKALMKFEMDNGFCYNRRALASGGYINYYQSSGVNIINSILDWDSYPECKLAIKTNKDKIITQINILEDDIKCAYILR